MLLYCRSVTSATAFVVVSAAPPRPSPWRPQAPAYLRPSRPRPALGGGGRQRAESWLQARDDPGDFMARLLHKYVVEGERKEELKADVKKSYVLLPDIAMDWMLTQVTDLISEAGPNDLEALLPGAPESKREALRDKYAADLTARNDLPLIPKGVEKQWAADFIDRTFAALHQIDQQKLVDAYLNAKLRETGQEVDDEE